MPAAATDKFKKLSRRWVGQIGSGGVADSSVTTIPLASTTNLPTDTAVVATIDRVDANGSATPSVEETVIGVVSGSNLINCVRGSEGTAQAHSAGAVVEILVTAKGYNDLIDGLLIEHNQDGTHKNALVTTLKATGAEINTGTNDTKIATPKAIADSDVAFLSDVPTDATLSTSDVTTNDVSTSKHGFAPKAPNDATKFLDGTGAYSTPSGGSINMATTGDIADFSNAGGNADITNATLTISPTGTAKVYAAFKCSVYNASASNITFKLLIDGNVVDQQVVGINASLPSLHLACALQGYASVASGSRVIKVQCDNGGTGTANVHFGNLTVIYSQ